MFVEYLGLFLFNIPTSKYNETTENSENKSNTDPTKKTGGERRCWRRVSSVCFL
jgi:hypothetical protein